MDSPSVQNNYPNWLQTHEILVARQVTSVLRTRENETRQGIQNSREIIARNRSLNNNLRNPLLIFPEEIWLMIFKAVGNVNDLHNASSTCSFFNEILNKYEYLFELVFPIICKHLPKSDILSCRAVCRRWSQGVDKYFENYSIPTKFPAPRLSYWYIRTKKILPFSNVFHWGGTYTGHESPIPIKQHEKNPFVGRRVILCLHFPHKEDNKPDNQFGSTLSFLENTGKHIWYLFVFVEPRFQVAADYYILCCNILKRCPNLKSLCLYGKSPTSVRQQDKFLMEHMQTDNLPILSFLEELDISVEGDVLIGSLIKRKFMHKYYNQLKHLKLAYWFPNNSLKWSRLEQLQIFVCRAKRKKFLQDLLQLDGNEVTKLSINKDLNYSQSRINEHVPYLKELLQVCRHFPKLRTLELQMEYTFDKILDQEISELPQSYNCCTSLTALKLNLENLKIPFSFLVCFPLLERLEITHTKPDWLNGKRSEYFYEENLGVIDIAKYIVEDKYGKEMYKSNIWQMLPALKVMKVGRYPAHTCHTYTREGYDHFFRKQEKI